MRIFQTRHRSLEQPHGMRGRSGDGDFINLGDPTQVVMIKGRDRLGWETMVHGVRSVETSQLSHVRLDQLETKERWTVMVARRLAVPIFGYRCKLGGEWRRIPVGWALGFHQDGQFVIAASVDDERVRSWCSGKMRRPGCWRRIGTSDHCSRRLLPGCSKKWLRSRWIEQGPVMRR